MVDSEAVEHRWTFLKLSQDTSDLSKGLGVYLLDFSWVLSSKIENFHATSDFLGFRPKIYGWASKMEFKWKWVQMKMLPQRSPKMLSELFEDIFGCPIIKKKSDRKFEGHIYNIKFEKLKIVILGLFFRFGVPF